MPDSDNSELSMDELKDVSGGVKHQIGHDNFAPKHTMGGLGCNAGERDPRVKKELEKWSGIEMQDQ